jgi:uncharacterized protein (TIGR03083 family)
VSDIWPVVHAERRALAEDLEALPRERWATPSLCPGWDVHDVLAHLVHDARTTRCSFVRDLVTARFDFDRANAAGVARERAVDPADTVVELRVTSGRTTSAPAPRATRLVEVFVHAEDVRRPLGIHRDYPPGPVVTALLHQLRTSTAIGGGRERAAGLRLVTTDADAAIGEGRVVRGRAIELLLAVSGRPVHPGGPAGWAALTPRR